MLPTYAPSDPVIPPLVNIGWVVESTEFDRADGRVGVQVLVNTKPPVPIVFDVAQAGGTLAVGQFYPDAGPFTIPAGAGESAFYFNLVASEIDVPGTIVFELSTSTPDVTVLPFTLTVTVTANVVPPRVDWGTNKFSFPEGGSGTPSILAEGSNTEDSTLVIERVGGTLTDQTATWEDQVTLPAGASDVQVPVSATEDGTLSLRITSCTPGHVGPLDTLDITVTSGSTELPVLRFTEQSLSVEEGNSVDVGIELSGPLGANLPIGIQLVPTESSASTADILIDGEEPPLASQSPGWVQRSIPAGSTSLTLPVEAVDDMMADNYETATLFLVYNPSLVSSTPTLRRTAILIDDGTAPSLDPTIQQVQFETLSTSLPNGATNQPVRLVRPQPPTNETVLVTLEVVSSSTATLGTHISVDTLQLQITDRNTTGSILASALDTSAERELVLRIIEVRRLNGTPATGPLSGNLEHAIQVGSTVPRFEPNTVRFTEGASASVNVVVDSVRPTDLTLTVERGNGNAPQVTIPSTVTIPAGQTSAPLNITSTDDAQLLGQLGVYAFVDGGQGASGRLTVICDDAKLTQAPRVRLVHRGGPTRVGEPKLVCVEVANPDVAVWADGDESFTLTPVGCTTDVPSVTLGPSTRYAEFVLTPTAANVQVTLAGALVEPGFAAFQGWDCALEGRSAELRWDRIAGTSGANLVEFTLPYLEADGSIPDVAAGGVKAQVHPIAWDEATRHPKLFKCFALLPSVPVRSMPGEGAPIPVTVGFGESFAAATIWEADLSTFQLQWKIVSNDDVFTARPFVPADPSIRKTETRFSGPYCRQTIVTFEVQLGAEAFGIIKVVRTSRSDVRCDKIEFIVTNAKCDPTEIDGDFSSEGDGIIWFDWIRATGFGGASGTQRVVNAWDRLGNATTEDQHTVSSGLNWTSVLTAALVNPAHAQPLGSARGFVRRMSVYDPTQCSEVTALYIAQGRNQGLAENGFGFEEGGFLGNMPLPRFSSLPTFDPSGNTPRWTAWDNYGQRFLNRYSGYAGLNRNTLHGNYANLPTKWAGWLKGVEPNDFGQGGQGLIWMGGTFGFSGNICAMFQLVCDLRLEMTHYISVNAATNEPLNVKEYTDPVGGRYPTEFSLGYQSDLLRVPQLADAPFDPAKSDQGHYRANRSKRWSSIGSRTAPFAQVWDQSNRNRNDSYCASAMTHISRDLSVHGTQFWLTGDYVARFAIETMGLTAACAVGFLGYDPSMPANYQRGAFFRENYGNLRATRTIGLDPAYDRSGVQKMVGKFTADDGTPRVYTHASAIVMHHLMVTDPATDTWSSVLDADPNPNLRFDELVQYQWGKPMSENGVVFVQGPDIDRFKRNYNAWGPTNLPDRSGSLPGHFSRFPDAPRSEQVPGIYQGTYAFHEGYATWLILPLMRRLKHKGTINWSLLPVCMRAEIMEDAIRAFDPDRLAPLPEFSHAQQSVLGFPTSTPTAGPTSARSVEGYYIGGQQVTPPFDLYPSFALGTILALCVGELGRPSNLGTLVERQTGSIRGLPPRDALIAWWAYLRYNMYGSDSTEYHNQAFPGVAAVDLTLRKYTT